LNNKQVGAHIHNLDLNLHHTAHMYRAAQEGVAFSFRYGLDIMRENGFSPSVIKAGKANMFLSEVFLATLVNAIDIPVELYECDGSIGAAKGAGIGAGYYAAAREAFHYTKPLQTVSPTKAAKYNELYTAWKERLDNLLKEGK